MKELKGLRNIEDYDGRIDFTFIVLTYNRPNLLRNRLESIANLEKVHASLEVIVVDDGSKSQNHFIVNDYKKKLDIRFYRKNYQGVAAARNYGMLIKISFGLD